MRGVIGMEVQRMQKPVLVEVQTTTVSSGRANVVGAESSAYSISGQVGAWPRIHVFTVCHSKGRRRVVLC